MSEIVSSSGKGSNQLTIKSRDDEQSFVWADLASMVYHIDRILSMSSLDEVHELDVSRLNDAMAFVFDQISEAVNVMTAELAATEIDPLYQYGSVYSEQFAGILGANIALKNLEGCRQGDVGKMLGVLTDIAEYAEGYKADLCRGEAPEVEMHILRDCIEELAKII